MSIRVVANTKATHSRSKTSVLEKDVVGGADLDRAWDLPPVRPRRFENCIAFVQSDEAAGLLVDVADVARWKICTVSTLLLDEKG